MEEAIHSDATDTLFERIFDVRPAAEVVEKYADVPPPRMLLGDLWREGEMALLFGGTNTGKSIFAVQVAAAIARGESVGPLANQTEAKTVLYVDLAMTHEQWARRYNQEYDEQHSERLKTPDLPANMIRVAVDAYHEMPEGQNFASFLGHGIRHLVRQHEAGVVIVDCLNALKRTNDSTRDVMPLVRALKRLSRDRGTSILLIAGTDPKEERKLDMRDLRSLRSLRHIVDSIFAIGIALSWGQRYIQQFKTSGREPMYPGHHTVMFTLKIAEGELLSLKFEKFAGHDQTHIDWQIPRHYVTIDRVHTLRTYGYSFREIAHDLGFSKTYIRQLYQQWIPPEQRMPGTNLDE